MVCMNPSLPQLYEHLGSISLWYVRPFNKPVYLLMKFSQKILRVSFNVWLEDEKETSSGTTYKITSLGIRMQIRMRA